MRPVLSHPWDLTPAEAIALQQQLRERVECRDRLPEVRRVAGVDVGFEADGQVTRAAVVVLELPGLQVVDQAVARLPTRFPYVPGLLSFRELPAVLAAFDGISTEPDLVLCDGQGIAHPRRFGIACHLGVLLDLPTIGVGKTRLVGRFEAPPDVKGAWTPLVDKDETVGAVLRSRAGVKPIFVSPGHRIGLEGAVAMTISCLTRFRLPETTRQAHKLASMHA